MDAERQTPSSLAEVREALAAPFPEGEVDFLANRAKDGRALAFPYVDARSVMQRLDDVAGPDAWEFEYEVQDAPHCKKVKGRLTVFGVTKCDAGEAATEGEPLKAAVSDALKRCAVHFSIGRYLYAIPAIWAPYDEGRKCFREKPRLPDWAMPNGRPRTQEQVRERVSAVMEGMAEEFKPINHGIRDEPPAGADGSNGVLVCSTDRCGVILTQGQHDVSMRAWQRPLCPSCQRQHAKPAAVAGGHGA